MTFSVFIYAVGGYAIIVLAGMLWLETAREPIRQQSRAHIPDRRLQVWPRVRRDCLGPHEPALPLRSARAVSPARRRRQAPRSCRR